MHVNLGVASDILEIAAFLFITPEVINWNSMLKAFHTKASADPEGVNAMIVIICLVLGLLVIGGLILWIDVSTVPVGKSKTPVRAFSIAPVFLLLPFLRRYLEEEENRRKVAKWIALFGAALFIVAKGLSMLHFSLDAEH